MLHYPNPVDDGFKLSGIDEIVELEIVGLLGEKVYTNKGFNGETIETKFFKQGIYFVQLLFKSGKTQTIKFIKN
jgi:hypothetical protein